ncbi:hypothetical protein [Deinococcus sp. YIM 77859]|uniref:hypothetical protein n=1 Tax=Deinococcus sp. YIM 77859 TaxID=1540221 RepID=UPI0005542AF1|nr:hypothetical protein [Deinococcus sp. YIM 77859]
MLLSVGVSLGVLVIAGAAVGGYLLLRKGLPQPVNPPPVQPGPGGLAVGNGVVAQVGSAGTGWSVQQALEAQQKKEAEWRRADKINQLERDLATAQNEIKRLTDQLNVIDASPMPADIITRWSMQHESDCKESRKLGAFFGLDQCWKYRDLSYGYQEKADADWAARKADQKRPILTRLSELNAQQLSLIQNLRELGVDKQPVNVRTS